MAIGNGVDETRALFDTLLADLPADPPRELKERVLDLLREMAPGYRTRIAEWESITSDVRTRLKLDISDDFTPPSLKDIPREFTVADKFEDIVDTGFFGDYLKYTQESEAPAQFHFGSLLACVSAALARRPLLGWQAAPLYPNIYALLVGPTGTRKSSALGKARELVELAFPKVGNTPARVNVLPQEGSPQGYASALRNRNYETSALSDGLIVASELTVLVSREPYKLAMGNWLTDWYDNIKPTWSRALKGDEVYELVKPYVCFAGASNMTWLKEIPESLIKAGYMPRHLVFSAREKRHDCANPKFDVRLLGAIVVRLQKAVMDIPEEMPLSPASELLMDEWYLKKVTRQERGEVDEQFAAWLSRKLPHALKVAVVWQMVDGGPRDALHSEWLRRAIKLVDWMDAGVLSVYYSLGSTGEGAATDAVMTFIERKGGKASLAAIGRGLKNKYNKRSVLSGVETLILARTVVSTQEPGVGLVLTLAKDV